VSRPTTKQSNSWASRAIIAQLARQLTLNKMEALSVAYINTLWNEFVPVISRARDVFPSDINNTVNNPELNDCANSYSCLSVSPTAETSNVW
jgi:hypothetical protein